MLKWLKDSISEGTKVISDAIAEDKRKKAAKHGFVKKGKCDQCGSDDTWVKRNHVMDIANENICYNCYRRVVVQINRSRG